MNRLSGSTSPYLRQHKDNPVDWWEWSDDAFAEARRRDVPVLLSVGYAACHWCHVMAHDSFEHDEVAAVMNAGFVNIKVDREERPDIDAVYMEATTALTGQGGWPMTCLLTPDGAPFYAGTFFPRANFLRLLAAVGEAWAENRADVLAAGQRIVASLAEQALPTSDTPLTADDLSAAVVSLVGSYDQARGGFGGAPKFPPSLVLEFLLRHHERTADQAALRMAAGTLDAMARGGIYDQLGGGFARYSVDDAWVVPHFEKMLYDNALLLRVYVHWFRLTGDPLAERVARETADFVLRDLLTPEGGFASALDADTDGVEGSTYVWTPEQIGSPEVAAQFGVTDEGTFEHGTSTLQLPGDQPAPEIRRALLERRNARPQPQRDDKVVTAWNGLMIAALSDAGADLAEPRYVEAAVACAHLLAGRHVVDGRLRRASRAGEVGHAVAVAEDYGDLAEGLLALHQVTADPRWLTLAGELLDLALAHFADGAGGFFDTADDAEVLVRRPKEPSDNATPSGGAALAHALLTYSALTASLPHRQAAVVALGAISWLGARQPRFLGWGLAAAEALIAGPLEIAVVGGGELAEVARRHRGPGAVVLSGAGDAPGVPLLADRPLVNGQPAAYVCRGMVCDAPVTTVEALRAALQVRTG